MTLTRVWTPSKNYSGGSSKRLIVLHTMEGFTGPNGAYDCAKYFQGNVGASSQVCIDNNRGKIWECVSRGNGSWTQCSYNSVAVSAEQSGYASWSRTTWLNNHANLLHNTADWIAEEAAKLGIPIKELTDSQAQGGAAGVTYHSRLGSTGCGHSDPGGGYPLDQVLAWAKGGSTPAPTGGPMSASTAYDSQGRAHSACLWSTDAKVNYLSPGGTWTGCDKGQTGARSGAHISYDPVHDKLRITYTNGSGAVCAYEKPVNGGSWAFVNLKGNAK